mgnify:CR=1 FL=1
MNFNIIVAVDTNNGIGLNNTIPWYEPEDLKHFAKLTKGNGKNAVIMGKNTWNSLPQRWLHNRFNIIINYTAVFCVAPAVVVTRSGVPDLWGLATTHWYCRSAALKCT